MALMFPHVSRRLNSLSGLWKQIHKSNNLLARYFLSDAYYCNQSWEKRLNSPILNKIKLESYYYEIDKKFTSKNPVSAVDIDIFANKVTKRDDLPDLEELIHRFRRTPNTIHTLESTHHAVIRAYLQHEDSSTLMRILNDRVNYGIFPDHFTYNLMMDTFLRQKNYRDAAKVATFLMLQEDFDNSLTNIFALYSCHMYLHNPQDLPWDPDEEPPKEDDGEDVWIRVRFVYEPWSDDHFDLRNSNHLVGKTLVQLGKKYENSLGKSYQALGWALFEKWDRLEQHLKDSPPIFKNCLDKISQCVSQISDEETKKKIEPKIQNILQKLKTIEEDPEKLLLEELKKEISKNEETDIKKINETYVKWMEIREKEIAQQISEYMKKERLTIIEERLEDLKKREELLFFFENLEKHRLNIPPEEEDQLINEEGKLSGKSLLDVPPEIEGKVGRYSSGIIEQHEPWWRWEKNKNQTEKDKEK